MGVACTRSANKLFFIAFECFIIVQRTLLLMDIRMQCDLDGYFLGCYPLASVLVQAAAGQVTATLIYNVYSTFILSYSVTSNMRSNSVTSNLWSISVLACVRVCVLACVHGSCVKSQGRPARGFCVPGHARGHAMVSISNMYFIGKEECVQQYSENERKRRSSNDLNITGFNITGFLFALLLDD